VRTRGIVIGLIAVSAAGCGLFDDDGIEVGSCLNRDESADGVTYETIDCERPHDLEVVGLLDADELGADYPGETALSRWAFEACAAAFEAFVGEPYGRSLLELDVRGPTEQAWSDGQRGVRCSAISADGSELSGSVAQ